MMMPMMKMKFSNFGIFLIIIGMKIQMNPYVKAVAVQVQIKNSFLLYVICKNETIRKNKYQNFLFKQVQLSIDFLFSCLQSSFGKGSSRFYFENFSAIESIENVSEGIFQASKSDSFLDSVQVFHLQPSPAWS